MIGIIGILIHLENIRVRFHTSVVDSGIGDTFESSDMNFGVLIARMNRKRREDTIHLEVE